MWSMRETQEEIDVYEAYDMLPTQESLFALKLNYVGFFTESPAKTYVNGDFSFFDCIDIDEFSVHELNDMVKKLGFSGKTIMYYSFLKPDMNLDNGLYALGNDDDVRRIAESIEFDPFFGLNIQPVAENETEDENRDDDSSDRDELVDEENEGTIHVFNNSSDIGPSQAIRPSQVNRSSQCDESSQSVKWTKRKIALTKGYTGPLKAKKFLGFDDAFIKGPFFSQLLTTISGDPKNGIYPLAYEIVETESKESWTWFLEHLKGYLYLQENSNFTFISDRQKGIIPVIIELFPAAKHIYCLRHIHENMKLRWSGTAYKDLLWKAVIALTIL
nr:hypothetical protein [Tanacetum cinerariifolium]